MTSINIKVAAARAAILFAAIKDVRYYLNAIHIRYEASGEVYVEATDGLVAFQDRGEEQSPGAAKSILIPLDAAKAIAKSKKAYALLEQVVEKYSCEGQLFTPIVGRAPHVDTLFSGSVVDDVRHYDFELLARAQRGLRTASGLKHAYFKLEHRGRVGVMRPTGAEYPRAAVGQLKFA